MDTLAVDLIAKADLAEVHSGVDVEEEEEEFDEEDLDVDSQSNVITHLLTQVRSALRSPGSCSAQVCLH